LSSGTIQITPTLALAEEEVVLAFKRATGPGGQNVNKVATAVELRFDVARSPTLTEPVRSRLIRLAGRRMTRDGVLVLHAQRFRTQDGNRQDVLARLIALIRRAAAPPRPRRRTRPPAASRRERLETKRRRGRVKQLRHAGPAVED